MATGPSILALQHKQQPPKPRPHRPRPADDEPAKL